MNVIAAAADTLDGRRLNFALQAGILRLLSKQEHLNKINVFPVPDGDTGTNLALTARAVLRSPIPMRTTPSPTGIMSPPSRRALPQSWSAPPNQIGKPASRKRG